MATAGIVGVQRSDATGEFNSDSIFSQWLVGVWNYACKNFFVKLFIMQLNIYFKAYSLIFLI